MEVTCRTVQGRFLLKPSKKLKRIVIGVLGRAQRLYSVEIHAFVFLSNHYHLLVSVEDALQMQMARFMNYLNSDVAREVGRMHRWKERFWGRRYQAIIVSDEEAAQVDRLRYVLSHGCKEGLVGRPEDWPGAQCVRALTRGEPLEGVWIDRTKQYGDRLLGKEPPSVEFERRELVQLDPLPCWRHLPTETYRSRIRELVKSIEVETRKLHSRGGTKPLGVRTVSSHNPHHRPRKLKKAVAPLCHAATRSARTELFKAYAWFVFAYREAVERLRRGAPDPRFPLSSFPPGLPFVGRVSDPAPG